MDGGDEGVSEGNGSRSGASHGFRWRSWRSQLGMRRSLILVIVAVVVVAVLVLDLVPILVYDGDDQGITNS